MRVLTITNWFPPHHFGGYELLCHDAMVHFLARGHDVQVLCSDTIVADAATPSPELEARTHRTLRLYHRDDALLRPPARERLAIERHNQAQLRSLLESHRPDVVSAWHFGALSLGLLTTVAEAGIPIAYNICDDWLVYGTKLDPWARLFTGSPARRGLGRVARRALGVPTVVPDLGPTGVALYISEQSAHRARSASPWSFRAETVVYSGIEAGLYDAPEPATQGPWHGRLICTGRFDPRKGQETLVRALPLLPTATAAFWGRGGDAERARLETLANELGVADRATFGSLHREQLSAAFADADAMVFPSTWPEPFGLTPLEAMACATPVVATAVGGSAEYLVDGVNCLWFEPGDPGSLARTVERLAGDEQLRQRLVRNGLATATDLTTDHLADALEPWHAWAAARYRGSAPPHRRLTIRRPRGTRLTVAIADGSLALAGLAPRHDGDVRAARFDRRASGAPAECTTPVVETDPVHLPFRSLPPRLTVDATWLTPNELAGLLTGIHRDQPSELRVTVRVPLSSDARAHKTALQRWFRGDHRPLPRPASSRQVGEVAKVAPPGWRVIHMAPEPFGPSVLGRAMTTVNTHVGRGRWAPTFRVELAPATPSAEHQEPRRRIKR